ncbi:biotin--[acetyl-CoA-carboxylase] ligase [Lactovum odontotermitis]
MTFFDKKLILDKNPWLTNLILLDETPSTQTEAKKGPKNSLYLTSRQTAGYGRFGREYFAPAQGGIYMSANLGPSKLDSPVQYTLLAAAAVVSAIEKLTSKKPQIKWVNDIYLGNKKFVGILAESSATALALGIGINFRITEFPAELRARASSLFSGEIPSISESELVAGIWSEFHRLKTENYLEIYKTHCFILGQNVAFTQNTINYEGLAVDLTELGELIVDCTDGVRRILNSGEISLKKSE